MREKTARLIATNLYWIAVALERLADQGEARDKGSDPPTTELTAPQLRIAEEQASEQTTQRAA